MLFFKSYFYFNAFIRIHIFLTFTNNDLHFHWKHISESDTTVQTAFRDEVLCSVPLRRVIPGSDSMSQSFLHPEQMIWTSDQSLPTSVKLFSCCCPKDDILPWDPVHLQSMRVSGYCIFSIDVPNDMTITDAGHESKVLNHPASWCVQQVLLSDLLWIHNTEAPHRNAHTVRPAPLSWSVLCPLYLVQVYTLASHGPHRLFLPCVNCAQWTQWPHQINQAWEEGEEKNYTSENSCAAYQSITLVPFNLARLKLEKHKCAWNTRITHVSNMLNFNW